MHHVFITIDIDIHTLHLGIYNWYKNYLTSARAGFLRIRLFALYGSPTPLLESIGLCYAAAVFSLLYEEGFLDGVGWCGQG